MHWPIALTNGMAKLSCVKGVGGNNKMHRLSIAATAIAMAASIVVVAGCVPQGQQTSGFAPIPRPAPDDPTPAGIAYLCDGRKEVSVIYAKNRASVTLDSRTWRVEYTPQEQGFRYIDTHVEWTGRDDLAALRESGGGAKPPLAYNCRPVKRLG
jgi:hypothetical protein